MGRVMFAALAAILTMGASEKPVPTPEEYFEDQKETLVAATALMYVLGSCDQFIDRKTINHYLSTWASGEPGDNEFLKFTQQLNAKSFADGRRDALGLNLDAERCQSMLDNLTAAVEAAGAKRKWGGTN